ncbi:MAG: hypothetical protein QMC81_03925 [Thermoanaerobacterales bacterium]|nr:hypothetical protein [Thermoanaerobacterales bacterium]
MAYRYGAAMAAARTPVVFVDGSEVAAGEVPVPRIIRYLDGLGVPRAKETGGEVDGPSGQGQG